MRDRDSGEVKEYNVSGDKPEVVEVIINWTHNIENTGETEMKLLVWADEVFDPEDLDTFPEEV
jgi:UDP-2-acetamido-2,6-beta-L-arabino-hexul-4-ose reductase